ncbi:MAG: ABC transporter substrate-binding protein, partial [Propionibacteriaceae bacterium]|nr:ABC transporter substrate-binding protein [Propionibacteriaceae bacterium]
MNRRHFLRTLTAAGLVTAGFGVVACQQQPSGTSPGGSTQATQKFTLGLTYTPDIQFAPFYVAAEKGYFTDAGLDVTLRHHGANEQLFGAIQAGQEDMVYAGGAEFMQARSQGVPLVSVATYYQEYPVVLVVPQDSPIQSAADLKGRSVGVPGPFG